MEREQAEKFRKTWKRTRHSLKPPASPSRNFPPSLNVNAVSVSRFRDPGKGLERLGKNLASENKIGWKEYWSFLDDFVDLASPEGLDLLEQHLAYRVASECSITPDLSFKGSPVHDTSTISDLCREFQSWGINDHSYKEERKIKIKIPDKKPEIAERNLEFFSKSELDPFSCVEKSCRVFAHRIANDILYLLETESDNSTNVALHAQIKPLQSLITSYINDERFSDVNFSAVHSRLGVLIANRLKESLKCEDEFKFVTRNIEIWLEKCGKTLDYFSSDDESVINHRGAIVKKKSTSEKQTMCLLECILNGLTDDSPGLEMDCETIWKDSKVCECVWQDRSDQLSFSRNCSVKRRKRGVFTFCSRNGGIENNVSKRLSFGDDENIGNYVFLKSFSSFQWAKKHFPDTNCSKSNSTSELSSDTTNKDSSDEEEDYYTPPESPSLLENSDDEAFYESHLPETEVYITG